MDQPPRLVETDQSDVRRLPPLSYWLRAAATVFGVGTLFLLGYVARGTLMAIAVALVFAFGFEPLIQIVMGRLHVRRGTAIAVILGMIALILIVFFLAVLPPLIAQFQLLVSQLPEMLSRLSTSTGPVATFIKEHDLGPKIQSFVKSLPDKLVQALPQILGMAGQFFSLFITVTMAISLWLYFLFYVPRLRKGAQWLFPPDWRQTVGDALDAMGGYLAGMVSVASVSGASAAVLLLILQVPYALVLGFWVALTNQIPYVGVWLGAGAAVIVAVATKGVWYGVAIIVYFLVYQELQSYVISPRLFGKHTGLSPVAVLATLMVGFALIGLLGAVLALPVVAGLKVLLMEYSRRRDAREAAEMAASGIAAEAAEEDAGATD